MLVLVATNELQGRSPGDYSHTVAGELVTPLAAQCDNDEECGCNRGFPGLASHRATTTAQVVELPHITKPDLRDAVYDYLDRGGWVDLLRQAVEARRVADLRRAAESGLVDGDDWDDPDRDDWDDPDLVIEEILDEHLEVIAMVCERYPVGTIIERSGTIVTARALPFAA